MHKDAMGIATLPAMMIRDAVMRMSDVGYKDVGDDVHMSHQIGAKSTAVLCHITELMNWFKHNIDDQII
jgi:hypothetical protein